MELTPPNVTASAEALTFVVAAAVDSLPPGHGRTVEVRGRRFALYNLAGEFYAIDDRCPHRSAPLGAGVLEGGRVYCPMHGWAFDLRTGACFSNPERPVACHPVRVANGEVLIGFDPTAPAGATTVRIDPTISPSL